MVPKKMRPRKVMYILMSGGGGVVDHSVEGIRILAKRSAQELIQNMTTKMGNYVDEEEERV